MDMKRYLKRRDAKLMEKALKERTAEDVTWGWIKYPFWIIVLIIIIVLVVAIWNTKNF